MDFTIFPKINATLSGITAIFLVAGYLYIRAGNRRTHVFCMLAASAATFLFVCSYLYYHYHAGSVKFTHQGSIRAVYFAILYSHIALAAIVVPAVITTIVFGFRKQWSKHRRIARWTFPAWLYVACTGVLVYLMLYQWFPPGTVN